MGRRRAFGGLLLVGALVFGLAPSAQADKVGDLKAQAARLADQRDRMNHEAERLAELYNKARVERAELQAQIEQLRAQLAEQDGAIGQLNGKLAQFAVQTYMYGDQASGLGSLLASDDAVASVAQRRGYSPVVLGSSVDVADVLKAARQDTDRLREQLDAKEAQQASLEKQIENRREQAAKAAEQAANLLVKTNADLRKAVIEEEQRRQAELQRQAAAEAARRAAELQAQRDREAREAAARRTSTATGTGTGTRTATGGTGRSVTPVAAPPDYPAPSPGAATAIAVAKAQLGKPYVFATAGPDTFDCSGLTQYAWAAAGVGMQHWTVAQYRSFPKVPVDAVQPGDLVFFGSDIGHVGIYIGGGLMIDAPYPGANVRVASIWSRNLLDYAVRPG